MKEIELPAKLEAFRENWQGRFRETELLQRGLIVQGVLAVMLSLSLALAGLALLDSFNGIFAGGIMLLLGGYAIYGLQQQWPRDVREDCLGDLVVQLYPDAVYQSKGDLDVKSFNRWRLFGRGAERLVCRDQIKGKIDKTTFDCSLVCATYTETTHSTDSEGRGVSNQETRTLFYGVLVRLDAPKLFSQGTWITTQKMIGPWFGKRRKVHLEDPRFNERFSVISEDQVEARYLLSPKLMERFVGVAEAFKALSATFFEDQLILALHLNEALPAWPKWGSLTSKAWLLRFWETFEIPQGLVDQLDFNTRIWSKIEGQVAPGLKP